MTYRTRKIIDNIVTIAGSIRYVASNCLYPDFCVNCGIFGTVLCSECFSQIAVVHTCTCFYCGKISKVGQVCANCRRKKHSLLDRILWATSYSDSAVKELIHSYKYDGVVDAGNILSEILNHRFVELSEIFSKYLVVPVPIHQSKLKKRGFNQSELFARSLSKRYGMHGGLALKRVKRTTTQVGLTKAERDTNLMDSIICSDSQLVLNQNILLIDDVATTGTTLNECAKVLKSAGAKKVSAYVVARG